jgi:trigger factor
VKSSVEALEGNKVKLYVEVEEAEMADAIDRAWVEIGKEVRLPGFRPGKAPKKVLKARIGESYARSEAIRMLVPENYAVALSDNLVDAIGQPEFNVTDGEESGPLEFEAEVEIRPQIEVEGYASISVQIPSPTPTDDAVADRIDQLRTRYSELTDVDRPVTSGDFVLIDISATDDGEAVDGLDVEDYLYQVGSGTIVAQLDEALIDATAGTTIEFGGPPPQGAAPDEGAEEYEYTVLVKAVQERILPELTDEWVQDATEFDSIGEFRDDVIEQLEGSRLAAARGAVRTEIHNKLAEMVTEDPPEVVVTELMQEQIVDLQRRVEGMGMRLEQFLSMSGSDPEQFLANVRADAVRNSKVDLALLAVARAQGLEATPEELDEEIEHLAFHAELDPETARHNLQRNGYMVGVLSDISKRKALDWLIETVDVTDEDGNAVERSQLMMPQHDHSDEGEDHDHDHDHGDDDQDGGEHTDEDE